MKKDKLVSYYKNKLSTTKPEFNDLTERVKSYEADELVRHLLHQCNTYPEDVRNLLNLKRQFPELRDVRVPHMEVHQIEKFKHYLHRYLLELENLDKQKITMRQLEKDSPYMFYSFCFWLYNTIYFKGERLPFLKF